MEDRYQYQVQQIFKIQKKFAGQSIENMPHGNEFNDDQNIQYAMVKYDDTDEKKKKKT